MAKDCGMLKYFEVSAKTGRDGVKEMFKAISTTRK
jgi:hypothetical protein